MEDCRITSSGGSLRLFGDRLVVRDGAGRVIRRCSYLETCELVALVAILETIDGDEPAFTPDGAVCARMVRKYSGRSLVVLSFGEVEMEFGFLEFCQLVHWLAALKEGPFFDLLRGYRSLDARRRLACCRQGTPDSREGMHA